MENKKSFVETVAEKIIEQLKQGTAPWQVPWHEDKRRTLPYNPITGKRYKGINTLNLMSQSMYKGYKDPRWLTYKQAQSLNAQVKQGQKSSPVQYWKFTELQDKLDKDGKPILDEDGKKVKEEVPLDKPRVFYANVFNAEQIDNLPPLPTHEEITWNPIDRAETILKNSGAKIFHDENRAYYSIKKDEIHLPAKELFNSNDKYYATVLHELGHWTGAESRLNRDLKNPFGSEGYAKEELRAEIASMILGNELNIGHDPSQHIAYVGHWIKILQDDPKELFRAASDAEKIQNYVLGFEQIIEQNKEISLPEKQLDESNLIHENMNTTEKKEITWLNIPYSEKNTVKNIAGKLGNGESAISWDKDKKMWFAKPGADLDKLKAWIPGQSLAKENLAKENVILAIPFEDKNVAKKLAGKLNDGSCAIEWDKANKVWFAKPGADLDKLKAWIPENINNIQQTMSPREEFTLVLQSIGCVVDGEHPIMDGQNHRIKTEGDKHGQKAGFYKAFLDGHPAGYIKNNRTGAEMKWKAKGYNLSNEERAKLIAEAAIRKELREKEQAEMYERVAESVMNKFSELPVLKEPTPYIQSKGIDVYPGIATDKENKITYIPAYDSTGKQWSTQYINEDGQKRFEKGGKKTGCFHVIGGQEALKNAPVIIISEGYATAATITKVVGYSTVAAFDSGNLKSVAKSLHEKFPTKPIIIAGDDDRYLDEKQGINPGKTKAIEAADAVNGKSIFPIFAPGENKLTDFNDLATKSVLGKDAIERQIKIAIKVNVEKQQQQQQQQKNINHKSQKLKIN
jgi:putative DNA primase/helicase